MLKRIPVIKSACQENNHMKIPEERKIKSRIAQR
jgi:hypothetical protein